MGSVMLDELDPGGLLLPELEVTVDGRGDDKVGSGSGARVSGGVEEHEGKLTWLGQLE